MSLPDRPFAAVACLTALTMLLGCRPQPLSPAQPAANSGEPDLMLWAWEAPEDLRTLDPAHAGVAFLAAEISLAEQARITGRRQPLYLAAGTWAMAVVRLEPSPAFRDSPTLRAQTVSAVLHAASLPGVRGLQIDFDATASQRHFYIAIARTLRVRLPPSFPLSVTALVSWCGSGDRWLNDLPVDEAVPMFFRMGGPLGTGATHARSYGAVSNPHCRGAAGLSTDERLPEAIPPRIRVYLFSPGTWTKNELARLNTSGYVALAGSASQTPAD